MSRYLILVLLNTPFIVAGILSAIASFKLGNSSRRYLAIRVLFWLIIFAGLVFAEPLYRFLFSNQLTETEPLSLFDVIQITGIIVVLFIANQAYSRVDRLDRRVHDLHEQLAIRLTEDESSIKDPDKKKA